MDKKIYFLYVVFNCCILSFINLRAQIHPPDILWDKSIGGQSSEVLQIALATNDGGIY